MLKVLPQKAVSIFKSRIIGAPQQLRDVFKISCNFTTKSNSSSAGHIPTPKSYTFKQNQKKSTVNITSYGWIMLVRTPLLLRHFVETYLTVTGNSIDNICTRVLASSTKEVERTIDR